MDSEVHKRYLITKTLRTEFPFDFITSKNTKHIVVQQCKALVNDFMVGDVELHANFIQRDYDCDHFCIYVNEIRTKYKKYEYTGKKSYFDIWFTDMKGNNVDVDTFTLELLLIY